MSHRSKLPAIDWLATAFGNENTDKQRNSGVLAGGRQQGFLRMQVTKRLAEFQRSTARLSFLNVVAPQNVGVADVEPSVGNHWVGPRLGLASLWLVWRREATLFTIALRRRLH